MYFNADGQGDNADTDDDNDGVADADDLFPRDSSESSDYDADGVGDNTDTDNFAFGALTDVNLSEFIESGLVTITGINNATISIRGGEYRIDGGEYVSTEGTISAGQSLQLRMLSAADFLTTSELNFSIANLAGRWQVSTQAQDITPDDFQFPDRQNVLGIFMSNQRRSS